MDESGPTAGYIIFLVLMLVDILLYGFGAAVRELSTKELSEAAEAGNRKAARIHEIAVKPNKYVNTLQFMVTLFNLIMGGFLIAGFKPEGIMLIVSEILLLYIILTFGILLPKKIAARYAQRWAYVCVNPVYYIMVIASPFTWLILVSCKVVLMLFGIRGDDNSEDVTEEEIISMVNEGHEQGVLLATEAEMITNIFEFGDKEAQDIMTHRINILGIDQNITLQEALDYMLSENKSRFPVYEDTIDHIVGILHFRDVIRAHTNKDNHSVSVGEITGLIRETMFVPETKNIDDLFKTMQQNKTHMVIVVDEYGQTSGILAMEDILEEIVGNIMDEYDEDEEYIEETENADEYIIDGITPLEELEERFGISFEEEEFDTLNGFLIAKLDKIPEDEDEGFSFVVEEYQFKILSVEKRMIKSVLVTKLSGIQENTDGKSDEEENKQE